MAAPAKLARAIGGLDIPSTSIIPFCRRQHNEKKNCVDQRRAVGVCIIKNYPARLPEIYQVHTSYMDLIMF